MNYLKMISKKVLALGAIFALVGVFAFAPTPSVMALDGKDDIRGSVEELQTGDNDTTVDGAIKDLVNVLLFALAAVAVVMIIFGGFRMTTSNGNADQVKSGKNTIMYAVIGLIVAILAYAIVNFVVDAFMSGGGASSRGGGVPTQRRAE